MNLPQEDGLCSAPYRTKGTEDWRARTTTLIIIRRIANARGPDYFTFMALSWLQFWKRRPAPPPTQRHVRMYTRAGCHLCEAAWQRLQRVQQRWGFTLDAVDIDADAALVEQYGDCVPVVTVDGKERFRGVVNPVLLERILHAKADPARPQSERQRQSADG